MCLVTTRSTGRERPHPGAPWWQVRGKELDNGTVAIPAAVPRHTPRPRCLWKFRRRRWWRWTQAVGLSFVCIIEGSSSILPMVNPCLLVSYPLAICKPPHIAGVPGSLHPSSRTRAGLGPGDCACISPRNNPAGEGGGGHRQRPCLRGWGGYNSIYLGRKTKSIPKS